MLKKRGHPVESRVGDVQGWARGSFVEAEAEVEAERSRQRRGKAAMFLTEARQRARGRGEAERNRCCLCHFDIMYNAHVVVTCCGQ